jgi:hypothetical protein
VRGEEAAARETAGAPAPTATLFPLPQPLARRVLGVPPPLSNRKAREADAGERFVAKFCESAWKASEAGRARGGTGGDRTPRRPPTPLAVECMR